MSRLRRGSGARLRARENERERRHMAHLRKVITLGLVVGALLAGGGTAMAGGQNYGTVSNPWPGIWYNGKVYAAPCYNEGGKHALNGYLRFQRDAGPALDTGRLYTASSTGSCATLTREKQVADSLLPGNTTHFYWGHSYAPWGAW
jgi:hypothetical protein